MLIAVNAGNSRVVLGGYQGDKMSFVASVASEPWQTGDYYAYSLQQIFRLHGVETSHIRGAVLGSVVPAMTPVLEKALRLLGVSDVVEVSSGVKTGLNIRSDQPRQIGSDRIACAVAARAKGRLPCVVVSLGTAASFTVLDSAGILVGSAITAGIQLSLSALRGRAAQLPAVPLDGTGGEVLARNTADAIRAGILYGAAAQVDGMVERFSEALGRQPHVVITGGEAPLILPLLRTAHEYDENLVLDGLRLIWKKNRS